MRIALATCRALPEPDPDAEPLLQALAALGAQVRWTPWDDPAIAYQDFDLCVIRSTWNYIHRLPDFLAWAKRVSTQTRLLNPWNIVHWNADKSYLRELAAAGVAAVPTVFVPRGSRPSLEAILAERGLSDVVIKPQVGAGSFSTRRFSAPSLPEGARFLAQLAAERDALVQPYIPSVETSGERALVWIAGELTHAVRKTPRFAGQEESVSPAIAPSADERAFAERVLKPYAADLLYARVDVARDQEGKLLLMELELIEPSLFLLQQPSALQRLAEACLTL